MSLLPPRSQAEADFQRLNYGPAPDDVASGRTALDALQAISTSHTGGSMNGEVNSVGDGYRDMEKWILLGGLINREAQEWYALKTGQPSPNRSVMEGLIGADYSSPIASQRNYALTSTLVVLGLIVGAVVLVSRA
jgi:hypothetical protein